MGLLSKGTPLSWEQSRRFHQYIKHHGILQFINIYRAMANRENEVFLWGDEVEHMLIEVDPVNNRARLACRAPEILEQLEEKMKEETQGEGISDSSGSSHDGSHSSWNAHFVPEYGRYMIEATPARPYGGYTADLRMVEPNMKLRRQMVQTLLKQNEMIMTLTAFPLLGVGEHCSPFHHPYGPIARSLYVSDALIGPHPRFATLSRNIRIRKGSKVCIRVPLLQDKNTQAHMKEQLQLRAQVVEMATHIETEQQLDIRANEADANERAGSIAAHLTSASAIPPTITSATNFLPDSGDELYPPIPDATCDPPINEYREIHMDAMAFGMGCCCLQVTFNTRSINEARHLYDHLAVLSPIMLAMSAATPFYRGRIADTDVRWSVISQSVDDRTNKERGLEDLNAVELERKASIADYDVQPGAELATHNTAAALYDDQTSTSTSTTNPSPSDSTNSTAAAASITTHSSSAARSPPQRLHKSRYDSISTYLSLESDFKPGYNDIPCEYDPQSYDTLIAAGIDQSLALHIAHLFVRDPLVIYDESIILDDITSSEHFENIQSTNWQTVRFKPPPPPFTAGLGWRVEFRTMEVQLTDYENAAFTVFVALVSRALLYFKLNFYLPLSKVDDNLAAAHARDAIMQGKFYWRKVIKSCPDDVIDCPEKRMQQVQQHDGDLSHEYELMSMKEIMLGKGTDYPGLIPIVRAYLESIRCDAQTLHVVNGYLTLLSMRATGQLLTAAAWLRKYVDVHPAYKHDSQLTQAVVCDMIRTIQQIQSGQIEVTQLLGKLRTGAVSTTPTADKHRSNSTEESKDESKAGMENGERSVENDKEDAGVELVSTPTVLDLHDPYCCATFREFLCQQAQQQQVLQSQLMADEEERIRH